MIDYKKYTISDALNVLVPEARFSIVNNDYGSIDWTNPDIQKPTEEEIQAKIEELQAAEPLRILRLERDRILQQTDWRFRSDLTPSQEWIDYCQALRDLPATAEPQLDENGNLTNVTWPEPPTE